jgi:hypothetical protein
MPWEFGNGAGGSNLADRVAVDLGEAFPSNPNAIENGLALELGS